MDIIHPSSTTTDHTTTSDAVPNINNIITSKTILVLYGSQTGNSEQAAYDFCNKCTSDHIYNTYENSSNQNGVNQNNEDTTTARKDKVNIITKCMSLDDFLEINHCFIPYNTCMILIFVSSYGVGGPPLGCYRFRDICDTIIQYKKIIKQIEHDGCTTASTTTTTSTATCTDGVLKKSNKNCNGITLTASTQRMIQDISFPNNNNNKIYYAICGLGDSKYTTYLNNPTIIDITLRDYLHATPLLSSTTTSSSSSSSSSMGCADASEIKWYISDTNKSDINNRDHPIIKKEQGDVIHEWIETLWEPLCNVIYTTMSDDEKNTTQKQQQQQLQQFQQQLIQLCQEIIPDYNCNNLPSVSIQNTKNASSTMIMNSTSYTNMAAIIISFVMVIIAILVGQHLIYI